MYFFLNYSLSFGDIFLLLNKFLIFHVNPKYCIMHFSLFKAELSLRYFSIASKPFLSSRELQDKRVFEDLG